MPECFDSIGNNLVKLFESYYLFGVIGRFIVEIKMGFIKYYSFLIPSVFKNYSKDHFKRL